MSKILKAITIGFLFVICFYPEMSMASDFKNLPKESSPRVIGLKLVHRYLDFPFRNFGGREHIKPNGVTYPEVCTWLGALKFAKITKNKELKSKLENRYYSLFDENQKLTPKPDHVDHTVFGAIPLELYMQTENRCFYYIGMNYADKQWEMPENPQHAEAYRSLLDQGLSWQTRFWIDDMYMISTIQSQAYLASGDRKYIDRAAFEMNIYLDSIQQSNGLFYHAGDVPFFWGRGNGWMAAGMTELLKNLPEDNLYRERIMSQYKKMMYTLKQYQRPDGMWGQLVDDPSSWAESSGTAMFTYAMITGVKRGWLDKKKFETVARTAWLALVSRINDKGDVTDVCEGTNKKNDRQYYLDRKRITGDMHGQAPLLWCTAALLE